MEGPDLIRWCYAQKLWNASALTCNISSAILALIQTPPSMLLLIPSFFKEQHHLSWVSCSHMCFYILTIAAMIEMWWNPCYGRLESHTNAPGGYREHHLVHRFVTNKLKLVTFPHLAVINRLHCASVWIFLKTCTSE